MRVAICGHSRAGKDTICAWLKTVTSMRYSNSTSEAAADLVYARWGHYRYADTAACFEDRHRHKETWHRLILEYNQPDGLALYRKMAEYTDIYNGIRDITEFNACKAHGLFDLAIWIKRPGFTESRLSCTVREADCDVTVVNNKDLNTLKLKTMRLFLLGDHHT